MTTQEMIKEFKVSIDKVDSQSYRDLQTGQILIFLNQAQDRYIKGKFDEFERTSRLSDDLKNIVSKDNSAGSISLSRTGQYIIPPINGAVFLVKLAVGITRTALPVITEKQYMDCVLISTPQTSSISITPYNSPYIRTPFMAMEQNGIRVFVDDMTTVLDAKVDFIRQWQRLTLADNSDLSEHTHGEIVALAVNIALRNIESDRVKENTQDVQQVIS